MQQKDINIERGGDLIESSFGISSKDSAHILTILRDKLYSNKILAVIREYCTNAQDAHAEAGIDTPIEVSLPTRLNSNFTVRDYGSGLSEEDVRNIYVMYGASTKRQSNNVVGQLGLGCKAAFAYTDKFTVTSWHKGEKKVYTAYIDETGVGKIALLTSEKSDESQGIKITIPVKQEHFYSFSDETCKLLRFFDPLPTVHGARLIPVEYSTKGEIPGGIKFAVQERGYTSHIVMGGVPYPITEHEIDCPNGYNKVLSLGVHIFVNIGDVEVAANREALEFTERTKNTLERYITAVAKAALEERGKQFTNSATYREANIALINTNLNHSFWVKLKTSLMWKGKQLDGYAIPSNNVFDIYHPYQQRNGNRWYESRSVSAFKSIKLFLVDTDRQWKTKLSQWIDYKGINTSDVYVLKPATGIEAKHIEKYWEERQLDDYDITPVSACKVPKEELKKMRTKSTRMSYSQSHVGSIFLLKEESQRPRLKNTKSKDWDKVEEIPDGKKYYVELDKFFIVLGKKKLEILEFEEVMNVCKSVGLSLDKLYGVKSAHLKKLDDDWVPLLKLIEESIDSSGFYQKVRDLNEYETYVTFQLEDFAAEVIDLPEGSVAKKLVDMTREIKEATKNMRQRRRSVANLLTELGIESKVGELEPTYNINETVEEAKRTYPLMDVLNVFPGKEEDRVGTYRYRYSRKTPVKEMEESFVQYVQLIEGEK